MKITKRDKYFRTLLYWSVESIKRGYSFMIPISLEIETINLLNDTLKLVEHEIDDIGMYKESNIINDDEYNILLKRLTMIKTYIIKRKRILNNT